MWPMDGFKVPPNIYLPSALLFPWTVRDSWIAPFHLQARTSDSLSLWAPVLNRSHFWNPDTFPCHYVCVGGGKMCEIVLDSSNSITHSSSQYSIHSLLWGTFKSEMWHTLERLLHIVSRRKVTVTFSQSTRSFFWDKCVVSIFEWMCTVDPPLWGNMFLTFTFP